MSDDVAWTRLTAATDLDWRVPLTWLSGLGYNHAAPVEVLVSLLDADEVHFLARNDLPPEVIDAAVAHGSPRVRAGAAEHGRSRLSAAHWDRLITAAPDPQQREHFMARMADQLDFRQRFHGRGVSLAPHADATPPRTPEAIAAMAAEVPDIDPDSFTIPLWWIGALYEDADAIRQLAASSNLLIRRSIARAPRLPADVLAVLAGGGDRVVKLFLAESCDDAPPEVLLEVASWWDGSFSFPGRPQDHPNFPRTGLLRLRTDPNPRLRALALRDPASDSALVEEFSNDPQEIVRRAVATDSRLSPESLRRLAADDDRGVRWRAHTNPSLPPDTLVTLLLEARSAESATGNPAIPVPVMRHMVAVGLTTARGTAPCPPRRA